MGIAALDRDQQAPAIVKEFGKARLRPRMLGSRQWVRGHEMHALGDMGRDRPDDAALDRADIRDRRAWFQHRFDFGGNRAHRPHRHAKHHQIGALGCFRGAVANPVAQANAACGVAGFLRAGIAGDFTGEAAALDRPEHRRCDQAKTDQGHTVINLAHA